MIFRFHKVEIKNLEGEILDIPIHKTLADKIYNFAEKVDLVDKAIQMNRAEDVDFSGEEIEGVKKVINDPRSMFLAFAKKGLLDYIEQVKQENKPKK